jgi:hypothetical protein
MYDFRHPNAPKTDRLALQEIRPITRIEAWKRGGWVDLELP